MNQNNSDDYQNPLNNIDYDKFIAVRDQLMTLPWAEIKQNKSIIKEALAEGPINAAYLVFLRRTFLLSQLFQNSEIIPKDSDEQSNALLNILLNFDLNRDKNELVAEANKIVPDIVLNDLAQLDKLQNDAKYINNALINLKYIAFIKIAEEIYPEISFLKNKSLVEIQEYITTIKSITSNIQAKLDQNIEPSQEDIDKAADFLKYLGHTNFEIEELKKNSNNFNLFYLLQKNREALIILQYANQNNLIDKMNDIEFIAEIISKTELSKG